MSKLIELSEFIQAAEQRAKAADARVDAGYRSNGGTIPRAEVHRLAELFVGTLEEIKGRFLETNAVLAAAAAQFQKLGEAADAPKD